jgi:hypothetical protein
MSNRTLHKNFIFKLCLLSLFSVAVAGGCSVSAESEIKKTETAAQKTDLPAEIKKTDSSLTKNPLPAGRIEIKPDSPADTVRSFYKNLRERRFREALMMTNLRPAVEALTDAELQDFSADFEILAQQVPEDIPINGEIITGDKASVTARMLDEDTNKPEDKVFKLRRENNAWIFLTTDEKTEKVVKKEGKNYLYKLRIDIHHTEAQAMLERIAKAQGIYAAQTGGVFADMETLVASGLLPADVQTSASTGYNYKIVLSFDKKRYFATAEPTVYGKTGKLSFLLESEGAAKKAKLSSKDIKGAALRS